MSYSAQSKTVLCVMQWFKPLSSCAQEFLPLLQETVGFPRGKFTSCNASQNNSQKQSYTAEGQILTMFSLI